MTFTQEEEELLKLMAAEKKARMELNKVNLAMGNAIRAEFATINTSIRESYSATLAPLEQNLINAQAALTSRFE